MNEFAPRWQADLALAAMALVWGATFVLVKGALEQVSPLVFLTLRFCLAAVVLGALFRTPLRRFRGRSARGGVIAGLFLAAGFVLQTMGLRLTTPSKSAFITGLYIALVPLLAAAVYQRAPRWSDLLGAGVATAGMGLFSLDEASSGIARGDWLTAGCAVAFAFHILLLGHYSSRQERGESPHERSQVLSVSQITTVAAVCGATFWWAETPVLRWNGAVVLALAVTSFLATALAFAVQTWAQQYTTPARTALIFSLEPVFAWLTSFAVTGEVLSLRATVGASLILAGVLLVELKPGARNAHPST